MMTSGFEFSMLTHIEQAPEDCSRRLVYADWLAEHGDPRCEFVRCEIKVDTLASEGAKGLEQAVNRLIDIGRPFEPSWRTRLMHGRISEILVPMAQLHRGKRKHRRRSLASR